MIFDLLEEAHKPLLSARIERMCETGGFLDGVDAIVCVGGSWLNPGKPALVCGFRGLASIFAQVSPGAHGDVKGDAADSSAGGEGQMKDEEDDVKVWGEREEMEGLLAPVGGGEHGSPGVDGGDDDVLLPVHSGYHGGALKREPMLDVVQLLASLHHANGSIAVPRIASLRPASSDEELAACEGAMFDVGAYASKTYGRSGAQNLASRSQKELLEGIWMAPCVTVHGIEGGWGKPGVKCMIPLSVTAKIGLYAAHHHRPHRSTHLCDCDA